MVLFLAISAELQARLHQLGQQLDHIDERKSATKMNIDIETDSEAKVSHVTLFATRTNKQTPEQPYKSSSQSRIITLISVPPQQIVVMTFLCKSCLGCRCIFM